MFSIYVELYTVVTLEDPYITRRSQTDFTRTECTYRITVMAYLMCTYPALITYYTYTRTAANKTVYVPVYIRVHYTAYAVHEYRYDGEPILTIPTTSDRTCC